MKKSEMYFKDLSSLDGGRKVITEANEALNDQSRIIVDSAISEVLSGALGAGAASVAVLAAHVAILGGIGVSVAAHVKNKKLAEEKHALYTKAIAKQNAILELLKDRAKLSAERIEYLTSLNTLLQAAVRDLKHDLDIAILIKKEIYS